MRHWGGQDGSSKLHGWAEFGSSFAGKRGIKEPCPVLWESPRRGSAGPEHPHRVPPKHSPVCLRVRFHHGYKPPAPIGPRRPSWPPSQPRRVWVFPSPPIASCFYISSWHRAINKEARGSCVPPAALGKGTNRDLPPAPRSVSLGSLSCLQVPKRSRILCQRGDMGPASYRIRSAVPGCKQQPFVGAKRGKDNRATKSSRNKRLRRKDGGKWGLKMFYF